MSRSHSRIAVLTAFALAATGLTVAFSPAPPAAAAEPAEVVLAGTFQHLFGCSDWQEDGCDGTAMQPVAGQTGLYDLELELPAGAYEYKVAVDGGALWYGVNGGAPNIPLNLPAPTKVRFVFDSSNGRTGLELPDRPLDGSYDEDGGKSQPPAVDPGAGQQFYFVLTDRFANGDDTNDNGGIVSGDPMETGFDPTNPGFYQGGDIQGIINKLNYIKGLGTTAIWLSPSFVNQPVQGAGANASAGYHGYWITDFTSIDPHLGGDEALKALITAAHANGMEVYFDIIANHTADLISYKDKSYTSLSGDIPYISQADSPYTDSDGVVIADLGALAASLSSAADFPEFDPATSFPYVPVRNGAITPSVLNDVTYYHNRGDIIGDQWNDQGEWTTMGDFNNLDDLMTENPAVVAAMIDIYTTWMDWGIDGFRIDTVKHVDFDFWKVFTAAIADYQASGAAGVQSDFFTFGEIYDQDVKGQTSPYMRETDMNAVLDFPFAFSARNWVKGGSGADLANLYAADDYYTTAHSDSQDLVTFLDNHDMGRFPWLLGSVSNLQERVGLANDLMFLTRGQPVVYYGDEQGIVGTGADKLCREDLFVNEAEAYKNTSLLDGGTLGTAEHYSETTTMYKRIAALGQLRKDHDEALVSGAQISLASQWSAYAFARVGEDEVENLVAVNSGDLPVAAWTFTTLTPNAVYTVYYHSGSADGPAVGDTVTADSAGQITLTVPALGAVVLEADRPVPEPATPATDGDGGNFTVTPGLDLNGVGVNTMVTGLAPVTATAPAAAWSETTFSVRVAGTEEWTILGTDTGPEPRVFHDTDAYPAGTLLEYRAVNVDAAGNKAAASTLARVGAPVELTPTKAGWVTLPGNFGVAIGCDKIWDPACEDGKMELDPATGLYMLTLPLPAGNYAYKVALDGTWAVNYGVGGVEKGDDKTFSIGSNQNVTFWYDPATHYFSETVQGLYTVAGDFLNELVASLGLTGAAGLDACSTDWANGSCGLTWMHEDPNNAGQYIWSTSDLPPGTYLSKSKINGTYIDIGTNNCAPSGSVVTDGTNRNCSFTVGAGQQVIFYLDTRAGKQDNYGNPYLSVVVRTPPPTPVSELRAYWIDKSTIAWPTAMLPAGLSPDAASWKLLTSPVGGIDNQSGPLEDSANASPVSYTLTRVANGLTPAQKAKFPTLADGYVRLTLPTDVTSNPNLLKAILKGETLVAAYSADGLLDSLTGTQNAGVIDAVYAANAKADLATSGSAPLGASFDGTESTFRLWAPTATAVKLRLYGNAAGTGASTDVTPVYDPSTGIWTWQGTDDQKDKAYDWLVDVYAMEFEYCLDGGVGCKEGEGGEDGEHPGDYHLSYDGVYNNTIVDPYATGLTVNSTHAVAVDPAAWKPKIKQPDPILSVDQTIYELHVRDFSINDETMAAPLRGTYEAFTDENSPGYNQLKELAAAGLTTIHLLPVYDIASIPELRADQETLSVTCEGGTGAGTGCREAVLAIAAADGFNWGYDPLHWLTPEGSYALDEDQTGVKRNREFADMVDALHGLGLRVVLDQVYNHTYASGQAADNVLDQVVPGYYHRLDDRGRVEKSTCCDEYAVEHAMAEQLMSDAIVMWARDYGIDGFRFDLMGFIPLSAMEAVQDRLAALAYDQGREGALRRDGSEERDPVYYLYGEGWNFGSIADNRLFYTAVQGQVNGTGIGTFSDLLRDAVIGGGYLTDTGYATGNLGNCPADDLRQGLAGNLYSYLFIYSCAGHQSGYASQPGETVSYVDAHDNQTLYDLLAMRLPATTSMDDRIRYNTIALATVAFAQTPAFWHAGSDLLRSKSLELDSYNSGDVFNLIDWTGAENAFGTGLPLKTAKDGTEWAGLMTQLLNDSNLYPSEDDALAAHAMALDLLKLRAETELFRLGTTDLIKDRVVFPDSGPGTVKAGLVTMVVEDPGEASDRPMRELGGDIDENYDSMLVAFNSSTETITQTLPAYKGRNWVLSDIQQNSDADDRVKETVWDPVTATLTIPALTAAVLFESPVFEVSFDKLDGLWPEAGPAPVQLVPPEGQAASPTDHEPTLAGHSFVCWYESAEQAAAADPADPASSGKCFDFGTKITGDLVLYAGYAPNSYEVSFDPGPDGADGTMKPVDVVYGATVHLPADEFTRSGYRFLGWTGLGDDGKCVAAATADWADQGEWALPTAADQTLCAQWAPETYKVVYYGNPASAGSSQQDSVVFGAAYEVRSDIGPAAGPGDDFSRPGYDFAGWNTADDGTGVSYAPGQKFASWSFTSDLVLFAQWRPISYNLDFVIDGKTVQTKVDYAARLDTSKPTAPAVDKPGYAFLGWYELSGASCPPPAGASPVDLAARTMPVGGLTLTACYSPAAHKVVFEKTASDATGVMADQTFSAVTGQSLEELKFSRSGYAFQGWATSLADAQAGKVAYADEETVAFAGDLLDADSLVLYAVWSPISYHLTFQNNGGPAVATRAVAFGQMTTLPAVYARTGYTFLGWATSSTGDPVYGLSAPYSLPAAADQELWAVWLPDSYRVVYEANGGSGTMAPEVALRGVAYDAQSNRFVRAGADFAGWNTAADGTGTAYGSDFVAFLTGDLVLYAQWSPHLNSLAFTGAGSYGPRLVAAGAVLADQSPPAAARAGYAFLGWFADPGDGSAVCPPEASGAPQDLAAAMPDQPLTLRACYAPT
ncbi:MAG: DUF3372 domain-containing protein, partial [Propionibacteriaceae bacterium]|nr:DUF3372 domain-containing protein [Propionibacteriaceae bacterium]